MGISKEYGMPLRLRQSQSDQKAREVLGEIMYFQKNRSWYLVEVIGNNTDIYQESYTLVFIKALYVHPTDITFFDEGHRVHTVSHLHGIPRGNWLLTDIPPP